MMVTIKKQGKRASEKNLKKVLTPSDNGCIIKTIKEQGIESPGRALNGPGQSPAGVKRKAKQLSIGGNKNETI